MVKKNDPGHVKGPVPFKHIIKSDFPDLKTMKVNKAVLIFGYEQNWISCRFANETKRSGSRFRQHQVGLVSEKQNEVTQASLVMRYS